MTINKTALRHRPLVLAGLIPALLLYGLTLQAEAAQAQQNPGEWRPLFNGRDLSGWYTWVGGKGRNSDPDKIFQVHDGMIHVYKDAVAGSRMPYGYIATEGELENYDIRLEFRWGEKKFAPRDRMVRDSGLLYHVVGADGAFGGGWPRSVECQIQEGDTGDICAVQTRLTTTLETDSLMYQSNGVPTTIDKGIIKHSRNSRELDGWNRVEVQIRGNCATHIVNGTVNAVVMDIRQPDPANPAHYIPLTKGKLLLQAEGAEVFYRNVEMRELPSASPAVAPQRYCNPISLPNYPVGRLGRNTKLGTPVHDPGHWRLEHQEQYRELADPTALWHKGRWFLYPSCDMAWVSEDEGLTWQHHPINIRDVGYAPSIVCHSGRFLLLASDSDLYTASSPLGPFTSLGRLQMPNVLGLPSQTDPMLFSDDNGRLYYYWGCTARSGIWAAELDAADPVRVVGQPRQVIAFEPDRHLWERLGNSNQDMNRGWLEGAWMLKHGDRYYLTYSAGGTEYRCYAMGCYVSNWPLGPFLPQRRNPIFRTPDGFVTGTAHGCVVYGPRARLWVFYTIFAGVAHNFERRLGFDLAAIDESGEIYVPAATSTPQPLPSPAGSPSAPVYEWLSLNHGERTVGSSTSPNLSGRFAADLSLLTWWQPAADDTNPVLTTKLIAASTIRAFRTVWRDVGLDTSSGGVPGPFRYRIEAETKPDIWTTVIDRSSNDQDLLIDYRECAPVLATRARLVVLGHPSGIAPGVTEFTVFGTVSRQ